MDLNIFIQWMSFCYMYNLFLVYLILIDSFLTSYELLICLFSLGNLKLTEIHVCVCAFIQFHVVWVWNMCLNMSLVYLFIWFIEYFFLRWASWPIRLKNSLLTGVTSTFFRDDRWPSGLETRFAHQKRWITIQHIAGAHCYDAGSDGTCLTPKMSGNFVCGEKEKRGERRC